MREIKFMVWLKREKKRLPVRQIHYGSDGCSDTIVVYPANSKNGYMVGNSCELMQDTGLLDKNGKKIFEGDIVKVRNDYKQVGELFHEFIGKVEFGSASFVINQDDCIKHHRWLYYECEIIGNIYENPELMDEVGK